MGFIPPSVTSPDGRHGARAASVVATASIVGVTALAWGYLAYQSWAMSHMDVVDMAMPGAREWGVLDLVLVFTMWVVMMIGMMAPSASPVLLLFTRIQHERHSRGSTGVASGLFLLGYLLAWTGFSVAATLIQWGLHSAMLISPAMIGTSPLLGGVVLIAAGIYQWTPAKHACLNHCRSPLGYLLNEWRDGARGALVMGWRHGLYCTGCCWLLMLVLFVVGVMNLLWIALLAAFVLLEKNLPRGRWVSHATGLALIAWGSWMALGVRADV
jgi:predicted metal-binding membrane protein